MPSPRTPQLRPRHVALITLGALALCALAAVLGYRWYTSPAQELERHLAEVEALPGVDRAEAHGDSPLLPRLHVTLEDAVTAEQVAALGTFAEDALYVSMSATLGTASLDPLSGWPDGESVDAFLHSAGLDLPPATPATRVVSGRTVELLHPEGADPLEAAHEVTAFLTDGADDAPPSVSSFQVRPDVPSRRRIALDRDLLGRDPGLVRAALETAGPLRDRLLALDVRGHETDVELFLEPGSTADDELALRDEVRSVVADLPTHADLPEGYQVWVAVDIGTGSDYFQAYPDPTTTS